MKKYYELRDAVEYIENHLMDHLDRSDIAAAAAVSLSSLQKMFKYSLGYSVNEYITKRKMSDAAAKLILDHENVTELAFEYGYQNVESFSRAFRRIYGVLPSDYRKTAKHGELFTQVELSENGIERDSDALVRALREKNDKYVVCFDIVDMIGINAISRQAGDIALMMALRRIHEHTGTDCLVFRIGGDEFAVITELSEAGEAEKFMESVLRQNGEGFTFDGKNIAVNMRGWFGRNASVSENQKPETTLQRNVKYRGMEGKANEK